MAANSFLSLPPEIILIILCYSPTPTDILSAQLTCKHIRNIIHRSDLLQYTLLLKLAGVEDVGAWPLNTSIRNRMKVLKRRQTAWTELHWQSIARIRTQIQDWYKYRVQSGYLVSQAIHSVSFATLPSSYRLESDASPPVWNEIQADCIAATRFATEHDLLALVTYKPYAVADKPWGTDVALQLWSPSAQTLHPLAVSPILSVYHHDDEWLSTKLVNIEIAGDYIGIDLASLCRSGTIEHRFFLVEWRAGLVAATQELPPLISIPYRNVFAFLRKDLILFTHPAENVLLIYKLVARKPGHSDLLPGIDFDLVRKLSLPEASVHKIIKSITCDCSPSTFAQSPHHVSQRFGTASGPFHESPDTAILQFIVTINARGSIDTDFVLIVHRHSLLGLLSPSILATPFGAVDLPMAGVITSEWKEWGPKHTRWFTKSDMGERLWKPYGQRLRPYHHVTHSGPILPYFWDFNPYTVRRLYAQIGNTRHILSSGAIQRVVTTKSVISASEFYFLDDVESELPYYEVKGGEDWLGWSWMDDERIVCTIQHADSGNEPEVAVYMLG